MPSKVRMALLLPSAAMTLGEARQPVQRGPPLADDHLMSQLAKQRCCNQAGGSVADDDDVEDSVHVERPFVLEAT